MLIAVLYYTVNYIGELFIVVRKYDTYGCFKKDGLVPAKENDVLFVVGLTSRKAFVAPEKHVALLKGELVVIHSINELRKLSI